MSNHNYERKPHQNFEFTLTINGNILCKRFFSVRDVDFENFKDVKPMMDELSGMNNDHFGSMGLIPSFLKENSVDFLWRTYNPYYKQIEEMIDRRDVFENEDIIGFKVTFFDSRRNGERLIGETAFSGNFFPPKVRYEINIKEIIPDIIRVIREHMSNS
jgi:hypothetical protein